MRASAKQLLCMSPLRPRSLPRCCLNIHYLPSVCDGFFQGTRQHHIWDHASADHGGSARTRHRRPRA